VNWNGDIHYRTVSDSITKLSERFAFFAADREEWFLKYCACKHFPFYIQEFVTSKPDFVAKWIEKNGYSTNRYPDGKVELTKDGVVLETLKGDL
jgi:hypothetical protein